MNKIFPLSRIKNYWNRVRIEKVTADWNFAICPENINDILFRISLLFGPFWNRFESIMVSLSFGVFDLGFLYEFLMDFNNFLFVIKLNFRSFIFWFFFVPSATIKNTICWCICRSSIYIRELQSALHLWVLNILF